MARKYVPHRGWATRPDHWTVSRAERVKAQTADKLATLCTRRLVAWRKAFTRKFPRFHGRIVFGMGTAAIDINSKRVYGASDLDGIRSLATLRDALDDVDDITDGFRLACPQDFKF